MSSIHRILRLVFLASVLVLLIAFPFSSKAFAARKHHVKDERHGHAQRRSTVKESRGRGIAPKEIRAERRPSSSRSRRDFASARRRAEAARLAAITRQRALEDAMRNQVQSMIAQDDQTGEDPEVRRIAVNALGNHAGTVVVMDPKTGRVYAIVNQQWALREGFKPCSTIKLVTGLAGLNERVIDLSEAADISDSNHFDLTHALAYSKNDYFQQVGGRVGFDKMVFYARQLGFGEKTGINARNESQGSVPTFKSGLAVNHMSSHGDGFKVTAVQLATLVSAMANGGTLLTPYVARAPQDEAKFKPGVRRQVNINVDSWRYMVPGMVGSVNYGSGRRAFDPQETVAGKTGTCIERGTWVGLFASYAPLSNPRLAIVVIARGADGRNHFPAAVAGRIYRDLNSRFGTPTDLQVTATRDANTPNSTADSESALNEERKTTDREESADADDDGATERTAGASVAVTPTTLWGDARTPANGKVKRTLLPIPNRNEQTAKPAAASKPVPKTAPVEQQAPRRAGAIPQ